MKNKKHPSKPMQTHIKDCCQGQRFVILNRYRRLCCVSVEDGFCHVGWLVDCFLVV